MRKVKHTLAVLQAIVCLFANAQVKTNFNNDRPITNRGQFMKNYRILTDFEIPPKDINALLNAERRLQAQSNDVKPLRLAQPVAVDLNIAARMNWVYEGDSAFGKFTIHLRGALSASINFDQFYLPPGTEMYIYNQNGKMITGPITEKENNAKRIWGSWVLQGPLLTIEIRTPISNLNELSLHSNNIAYGYKEVYQKIGGFGQSGACEINIVCPLGSGWDAERNSVACLLGDDGSEICSGAMVRNTCDTYRPFFLTANHCYATSPTQNVSAWRFTFQAWSSTCTPSANSNGVTYNGSTLRANWANSDFCLVELANTPDASSYINYAGWSRSTTAASSGTAIHHPEGDVMKISRANNTLNLDTYPGTPTNSHWRVNWSAQTNNNVTVTPVTEAGSSGSPLFDQNHRIVGQLHGGPSACNGSSLWDFYGRFDLSWTGGGTSATRLSDWLDPTGSGATTTNTINVSDLYPSISGDNEFCTTSGSYTITHLPAGASVVWTASPSGVVTINSSTSTSTTLTRLTDGIITLTATITGGCTVSTVQISKFAIRVGAPAATDIIGMEDNVYLTAGQYLNLYVSEIVSGYEWSISGATITTGTTSSQYITVKLDNCYPNQVTYNNFSAAIRLTNSCGTSAWYSENTYAVCTGDDPIDGRFAVYPNPTVDNVTIDGKAKGLSIKEIQIMDKLGVVRAVKKYTGDLKTVTISVSNLPADLYYIRIFDGTRWETKQLRVK